MSKITLVALIFLLLNSHIYAERKGRNNQQLYRKATKSLCTDGLKKIEKYRAGMTLPQGYFSIATGCRNPAVKKLYVLSFSTCPNNATQKFDDVKNDVETVCECDFKDSCEHQLKFVFEERNFNKTIDHCHTTCKSWVSDSKTAEHYCYELDWTSTTNLSERLPAANSSMGCNTTSSTTPSTAPSASANPPSLLTVMAFLCFLNR